ncbi:hypothetical protein [Bradyrhizobium roseum]|uniref:hypothetical protein n=1 Tax=Bradyrhizobium roseum TaxID=3056648 RepID=UPI0026221C1D|nr:hypothetical protein [Bradyrhizobium roseus]WKA25656.1 hypothetical protein QUH67_18680 [Bradyrhizobium roseus]
MNAEAGLQPVRSLARRHAATVADKQWRMIVVRAGSTPLDQRRFDETPQRGLITDA